MHAPAPSSGADTKRHRPRMTTVFGASFLAGAVLAFGINRVLDVHVTQAQPQVECEPIFVALRSMPQGSPVTIWDVALRDWPKAMLPTTALRAHDTFSGTVLKYPLREGQPLLSVQLVRDTTSAPATDVADAGAPDATPAPVTVAAATPAADAWTPVLADPVAPIAAESAPQADAETIAPPVTVVEPAPVEPAPVVEQAAVPSIATPDAPTEGFDEAEVTDLPATVAAAPATPAMMPPPNASDATEPVAAPTPVEEPTLADEPTPAGEPTLADTGSLPFAPPVPSLPPTDIGGALAEVSAPRSRLTESPAAAPATDSVLADATAAAASGPKRYLVVPERIALQADASFVEQPPAPPQPEPAATAGARPTSKTATAGTPKRPASQTREPSPAEKKPTLRGGGWFSGSPQAWGGIGAALRRPQADQSPGGPR